MANYNQNSNIDFTIHFNVITVRGDKKITVSSVNAKSINVLEIEDNDLNVPRTIKIEIVDKSEGETTTDIQNYLKSFNKEIQVIPESVNTQGGESSSKSVEENGNEGTYFITENGACFYQTNSINLQNTEVVTVIPGKDGNSENALILEAQENGQEIQNSNSSDKGAASDSRILLSGSTYQTVTIVPSESNPGEVSYVLIVQPPEDDKSNLNNGQQNENDNDENGDDQDLGIYDFDEGENPIGGATDSGGEDEKKKIKLVHSKKSQNVSQSHMCNYCNYTSPKRYLLARHMKSHSEERPHKCSVCERGFKTLASLQNHVNTHTGTKPHGCKHCDSCFTTSGELVRHVRYKHTHEKPHKCSMCDYASVELSKMRNHMRCHTGERPYQCHHCTYASPDSFKLKRHLRIHTGERPYECTICGHRFTQSNSLKAHLLIHCDGDKPQFRCELCPATCGRKTDLRIHVQKLHTQGRMFICRRCGKQFHDRYSFKIHNKSHNGEKCWRCELCPYASISHRHLESHMLVHTDQKPFTCNMCDQRFRQKQLLKRHQNLYHNPGYIPPAPREKTHECPECKKCFRHKGNLIRHLSVHDPESGLIKEAVALKLGRQKKIKVLNGQHLQIESDTDGESDENVSTIMMPKSSLDKSLVSVEGDDGHQYVLLEVIQIPSNNNEQDPLANSDKPSAESEEFIIPEIPDIKPDIKLEHSNMKQEIIDTIDLDNCFGFCESDEENLENTNV